MAGNTNLSKAKKAKNDEFYTQIADIEREIRHYRHHFKDKVVFCNCDDPEYSEFFAYFHLNFEELGLKKLICTHYDAEKPTYVLILKEDRNGDGKIDINDVEKYPLSQNGDFRSEECIEYLKEADIVVTNPPFSLFREYVAQLMEYEKKFIIIGNVNAITYKEIFPLIKNNKIWAGFSFNKTMEFIMPDSYELKGKAFIDDEGKKHGFVPGICWFTNLDIKKRHENLILWKTYTPEEFPKYDNYDAINVDKVANIPCDYYEAMGVPITFLDKFNPDQFEIIGLSENGGKGLSNGLRNENSKVSHPLIGGAEDTNASLSVEWFPINDKNRDKAMKLIDDYGFPYRNGVMGVPITFLDKFNPKQFEIVQFRKGEDGKDLIFSRGGKNSSTVLSYPCTTQIPGLIKNAEGKINGKITYARITIRRILNQ